MADAPPSPRLLCTLHPSTTSHSPLRPSSQTPTSPLVPPYPTRVSGIHPSEPALTPAPTLDPILTTLPAKPLRLPLHHSAPAPLRISRTGTHSSHSDSHFKLRSEVGVLEMGAEENWSGEQWQMLDRAAGRKPNKYT